MTSVFSILGRYLMWRTLTGMAIVLGAVAAVILLVDVVEQMRTVASRAELTLWGAMGLTALKAPQLIEQILPFVVLAGTMIGLLQLNRRSELVAIRASGVSAWSFLAPTGLIALLLGVASPLVLNPIGAAAFDRFEEVRDAILDREPIDQRNGIWLRQGDDGIQTVIHGRALTQTATGLQDATFYSFTVGDDGALRFTERVYARQAILRPSRMWELRDYVQVRPDLPAVRAEILSVPTSLEAAALFEKTITSSALSFWRLPEVIEQARAAGLSSVRFELRRQTLLATPALMIAMAMLGAVFSLRLQRLGGLPGYVAMGVGTGFVVFFAGQLAQAFAVAEAVPPAVAAWCPPLTGVFSALAVLSFVEDG